MSNSAFARTLEVLRFPMPASEVDDNDMKVEVFVPATQSGAVGSRSTA